MSQILVQGIGFAGVIFFVASYQIRSNRALFLCQTIGNLMFCIQFFFLDAVSGCLSLTLNILRNILLIKYNDWAWVRWKGWMWVFLAACAAVLFLTWSGPVSLLPFAAMTGSMIGYFTRNAQKIRLANLVCISPCWLLYDILVHSWGGILSETFTLTSILLSICRYGWKAMGDPDSDFQN
ncbi:MAG: YgjV family protein [Emergencia sp.]